MRKSHEVFWRKEVEPHRVAGEKEWGATGAFQFGSIKVICSEGEGWDHVSVSLNDRTPTWEEMARIKTIFFGPEEIVMQLHPPESKYVNRHPFCLHMWRPQKTEIPLPPQWMV